MDIEIRQAEESDADCVSRLILDMAKFFLSDPSAKESQPFLATVIPQAVAERISALNFRCYVAEDAVGICGFAALRDDSHLYHLFVSSRSHRQGVARALWQHAKARSCSSSFTVNSSLFAVPVYERLGFVATATPQSKDGLEFVPMVYPHGS
jgi:GNAT superfamily N-acetyltransferase